MIAPNTPYLLAVQGLALAHVGSQAFVRDINFTLATGASLVILGPNGSGKTTLLRTLLGLVPVSAGRILFNQNQANLADTYCAYVPQLSVSFNGFSASQVIQIGLMVHKPWYAQPRAHEQALALNALETLGIAALAQADFATLSGGEQQLVLIARALAMNAKIILLDEPAASLDIANQARLMALCLRLKQRGVALIITTHNPQHALALGVEPHDKTLTISSDGKVITGATFNVCTSTNLTALYGVPVEVVQTAKGLVALA